MIDDIVIVAHREEGKLFKNPILNVSPFVSQQLSREKREYVRKGHTYEKPLFFWALVQPTAAELELIKQHYRQDYVIVSSDKSMTAEMIVAQLKLDFISKDLKVLQQGHAEALAEIQKPDSLIKRAISLHGLLPIAMGILGMFLLKF